MVRTYFDETVMIRQNERWKAKKPTNSQKSRFQCIWRLWRSNHLLAWSRQPFPLRLLHWIVIPTCTKFVRIMFQGWWGLQVFHPLHWRYRPNNSTEKSEAEDRCRGEFAGVSWLMMPELVSVNDAWACECQGSSNYSGLDRHKNNTRSCTRTR